MASGDTQQKNTFCRGKNPSILIRKLINLMEHPISGKAPERQLQVLQNFLNCSSHAFWLQDIPYVIRLYEIIVKKLDQNQKFKEPLISLLELSALPPMMIKISDKLNYARDLQEYFSTLGYLIICLHEKHDKELVINAIRGLLTYKFPSACCFVPLADRKKAAEQSRLPEILSQVLQVVEDNIYTDILDIMFRTCQISTIACQKMLPENAIEFLLQRLDSNWKERNQNIKPNNPSRKHKIPQFEDTCSILWKLLNVVDSEQNKLEPPSQFALWSLQYAFRWSNISPGHKKNRNNIAAIITKILMTFPNINFTDGDVFDDLLFVAFELTGSGETPLLLFSETDVDYQYKKIIFSCLHFYSEEKIRTAQVSNEIITAFLKVLLQEHSNTKHHVEQCCELVKIVFRIIPKFIINSDKIFTTLDGPNMVVSRIEFFLENNYDPVLLQSYTNCLRIILEVKSEIILSKIQGTDLANIFIALCNKIIQSKTLTTLLQQILSQIFIILQLLLKSGNITNIEIINICINYLNRVITPTENDPFIDSRVTICVIHLLWECLFAFKSFYREFLKKGGVYVMLDITEISTFTVKSISLGILDDISVKISSIPYLITWRKRGRRLMPMLLEIFRNKTEKICDSQKNIQLFNERSETVWLKICEKNPNKYTQKCITQKELLRKSRARIQGILSVLKEKHKDKVELANDHYKLFNEKLNTDDELTMLFAENFLSLHMCQSWIDVAKEIKVEKIKLIKSDKDQLKERILTIRQWKCYLQNKIESIVHNELQKEQYNELETYNTLKQARLSDALDALKELRFVSNTTEKMFKLRQKLLLEKEIETINSTSRHFHRTISNLPFMNMYNQHVDIQSNIIYEKKSVEPPVTPVSLDENEPLVIEDIDHELSDYNLNC